jgi:deazaflavin-dependent oxidoreductase (nitroreductase family)
MYRSERRNPLVRSTAGGRLLSAMQLPAFTVMPPPGYGVITTTGRRTGKQRRKCIRIVRRGDRAYIVAIPGSRTAWLSNIRANPHVRLRTTGATLVGVAREPADDSERTAAIAAF